MHQLHCRNHQNEEKDAGNEPSYKKVISFLPEDAV